MKPKALLFAAALSAALAPSAPAQLANITAFKRPNIANIFHPVVGSGAAYEQTSELGAKSTVEMSVVDKEMVGTQQGYWMEVGHAAEDSGALTYGKMLVTPDDFAFHKMIFLMPGSSQPMEMDLDAQKSHRPDIKENLDKWHSVATESVTVPAGTFSCEHWKKDDGKGDAWVSSKVSPMSLVKYVDGGETMVLVKVISDAKTHITGTPVKFDPQMMMKQRR
jgi:hypothetical protein